MYINEEHRVTTIDCAAADLVESIDSLDGVAMGMAAADGVIWIYQRGDDQVTTYTDFGIDTPIELIKVDFSLSDSNS